MNEILWTCFALVLVLPVHTESQTCSVVPKQPKPYTDKILRWSEITHLKAFELLRCVLECFLVKLCASFNHKDVGGLCTLNMRMASEIGLSHLDNETGYVYHERQAWSDFQYMAGTCASRPCAENQRCFQTTPYKCVDVDCGPNKIKHTSGEPPYQFISATSPSNTSLGSGTFFACIDDWAQDWYIVSDYAPWLDPMRSVCSSDFRWSPVHVGCYSKIANCAHVKACNQAYGDGHYLLYGSTFGLSIIYCHDMAGTPAEYITLPPLDNWSQNTGDSSITPKQTKFSKVRVHLDNGTRLNITDVFVEGSNTPTIATTTSATSFGTAASCPSGSGSAKFQINIADTGYSFPAGNSWTGSHATDYVVESLDMSYTSVIGQCGGTACGYCFPVAADGSEAFSAADGSEAIMPICTEA